MTADIVLWLDLAEENDVRGGDARIRDALPPGAIPLRLSEHGVPQCPEGSPPQWRPVLEGIERMLRTAREHERSAGGARFWVTGRAALPAFLFLGYRLSKRAAVTLVHQPQNLGEPAVLDLEAPPDDSAPAYFTRSTLTEPGDPGPHPLAIAWASLREVTPEQISSQVRRALAEHGTRPGAIAMALTTARLVAATAPTATREIEQSLHAACGAHPDRSSLAVFVGGPTSLAFLVGRALVPRICGDMQIFDFQRGRYQLAFDLPFPPVPERNLALALLASPLDEDTLALEEELRGIRRALVGDGSSDRLQIVDQPAARPRDLLEALLTHRPGIVHFSGHGDTGELLFEDDRGCATPVASADLSEVLRVAGASVHLAVLNACRSESLAEALLAHVDCVISMRGRIYDDDARAFSRALYRALASGQTVQHAFDTALTAMRLDRASAPAGGPRYSPPASAEPPRLIERDPGRTARDLWIVRPPARSAR